MSRPLRSKIAQETVALCDTGRYVTPSGRQVEIAPTIRESVANTAIYSPETLADISISELRRDTKLVLWSWATVIALSTLLTHHHHVIDVIAGWAVGIGAYRVANADQKVHEHLRAI